jgi:hypothetical protein
MKPVRHIEQSSSNGTDKLPPRRLNVDAEKDTKHDSTAPEASAPSSKKSSLLKAMCYWVLSRS